VNSVIELKTLLEVLSLLVAVIAIAFTGFRWMSGRLDKTLDRLQTKSDEQHKELESKHKDMEDKHEVLRRDLVNLKESLPFAYVLREYYIEQQSLINQKLDSLANKLDGAMNRRTIVCRGANKKVDEE